MLEIPNLENHYEETKEKDPRKAAELAYVIAMLAKKEGENEKAVRYGRESITLFDSLNVQTMDECTTRYVTVNGISLPDYIHSDVVRDRLSPLQL